MIKFKTFLIVLENNIQITVIKRFSTIKTNIVLDISKKFKNVPLVDFPLIKPEKFNLSNYEKIEKAFNQCCDANLDNNPNRYPSITAILNQTMPPESLAALKKWEMEKIKKLGKEGFEIYRKELFTRGRILHKNVQSYLETKDISKVMFVNKIQENMWKSIEMVLPRINKIYASEMPVYHPILKFRGILDSLAIYESVPAIIEWKTSEKIRPTLAHTYDNPLQAVAYYSCLQFSSSIEYQKEIKNVILIIAYEDGTKASVHLIEQFLQNTIWRKFLQRLEQFWHKNG